MFGTRKYKWKQLSIGYIDLSDEEFSFVYLSKPKSAGLVERNLLYKEALRRNLDEQTMKVLVKEREFKSINYGCHRCNTQKPFVKDICVVCGYKKISISEPRYFVMLEVLFEMVGAVLDGLGS